MLLLIMNDKMILVCLFLCAWKKNPTPCTVSFSLCAADRRAHVRRKLHGGSLGARFDSSSSRLAAWAHAWQSRKSSLLRFPLCQRFMLPKRRPWSWAHRAASTTANIHASFHALLMAAAMPRLSGESRWLLLLLNLNKRESRFSVCWGRCHLW